jgi:hypothetical protein
MAVRLCGRFDIFFGMLSQMKIRPLEFSSPRLNDRRAIFEGGARMGKAMQSIAFWGIILCLALAAAWLDYSF